MNATFENPEFWIGWVLVLFGVVVIVGLVRSGEWRKPVPPASLAALKSRAAPVGVIILGIHLIVSSYVHH